MKRRGFNFACFVEVLSYFLISLMLFILVREGLYLNYVTVKMKGYLYFSSFVFLCFGVLSIPRVFRAKYKQNMQHCLVLLIPVFLLLLSRDKLAVTDGIATYTGAKAVQLILEDNQENHNAQGHYHSEVTNQELEGIDIENNQIYVSNDTYLTWVTELFANCQAYDGYEIRISGRVYKEEKLEENKEFAITRMLMSCCTVDLIPYGPLCQYDKMDSLQANDWVEIVGTIHCRNVEGRVEPVIMVHEVKRANPPKIEYLYY